MNSYGFIETTEPYNTDNSMNILQCRVNVISV